MHIETDQPAPRPEANRAGEIWGGLASMLVALPSAIAFGVAIYGALGATHLAQGAMAGMLGAAALGLLAPVFGGTPRLISAPCAPAAAVLSALVAGLASNSTLSPQQIMLLLALVALVSAGLQWCFGFFGAGRMIKYIPYPVVSGYLSGVGVLIFLSQLPKWLGLPNDVAVLEGLMTPHLWQWPGLVVGGVTIGVIFLAPRFTQAVPATILGLAAGLLAYFGLALMWPAEELWRLEGNRLLIGPVGGSVASFLSELPDRWTAWRIIRLHDLEPVFAAALTLSVLLSIDTLKTCVVLDALTRSRHDSNRELRGQGIGNLASALLGGIPGAGTMGATLVNVNSGGKTRLSGVMEGVFVVAALLLLGRFIGWVPIAALAGILIVVAFRMFDRSCFHLLRNRATILDFCVIAAVVIVAIRFNLIAAAGAGLGLAILLFIREQIRGSVIRRKLYGHQIFSKQHRLPVEKEILHRLGTTTTVCELQGSLFFGTTDQLFAELETDLKSSRYLILDMRRVQSVDFTAVHMLEQIEAILKERQGYLVFSSLPASLPTGQHLRSYFKQLGLVAPSQNARVFESLDEALEWAEDRILREARFQKELEEAPLGLTEFELLKDATTAELDAMKDCTVEKTFAAGEMIFKKGGEGDELFLIRRGIVRIILPLNGEKHCTVASFSRDDFFGDMSFLDRGTRSADALAVTPVDLWVLSRGRFNQVVKAHPDLGVKFFARLARVMAIRLRYADSEIRALLES